MTTTGYIYDPINGRNVARIENDVDVIDTTIPKGSKIAILRNGNIYDLKGELLGHLAVPDGGQIPAPDALTALLGKPG